MTVYTPTQSTSHPYLKSIIKQLKLYALFEACVAYDVWLYRAIQYHNKITINM